ncbi:MAG: hypothetical protein ABF969_04235 [Sporolactobacillus sp.]
MPMFDFSDMLAEYSLPLTMLQPEMPGHHDENGEWVPGSDPVEVPITGALIPFSQNEIYQSGGRLTQSDRQLLIDRADIPMKTMIVHDGQKYSVEGKTPYSDYADFDQYELKWVSAFD